MEYFNNVKIPVFGVDAVESAWAAPVAPESAGVFFADDDWLRQTNATRIGGVVEGIAKSVDYNTVLRQCTVMASLLANILAYRNRLVRSGQGVPYGNADIDGGGVVNNIPIGTKLLHQETDILDHIGKLSSIFNATNFLADGEVVERTIGANAITEDKIKPLNVTSGKLGTEAVTLSKLGSGLVSTGGGSSTANGVKVTLSQKAATGDRGFMITVESSKVTNSENADKAADADKLKTDTTSDKFYLSGTKSMANTDPKLFFNSASVYVTDGYFVNAMGFNVTSDAKLKENFEDVGKNQIRALVEGVGIKTFNFKDNPKKSFIGMTAQDILEQGTVLGDLLVCEDENTGNLSISESKLVYVLWNYVQQQSKKIEALEKLVLSIKESLV